MSGSGAWHTLWHGIKHLVSPSVCRICGSSLTAKEDVLCLSCLLALPRTYQHRSDFNEIHRRLGHHHQVDRAAGWYYYKKGTAYARLLVDAKYDGMHHVCYRLGQLCAQELVADHFFDGIDVLVPMPIHWIKRWRRGYNQAYEICRGISQVTGIECREVLRAVKSHGVQSRHTRLQRLQSIKDTMAVVDAAAVKGRNVLLVDDIITSGASCIEALRALSAASPASLNVLSLGLTLRN